MSERNDKQLDINLTNEEAGINTPSVANLGLPKQEEPKSDLISEEDRDFFARHGVLDKVIARRQNLLAEKLSATTQNITKAINTESDTLENEVVNPEDNISNQNTEVNKTTANNKNKLVTRRKVLQTIGVLGLVGAGMLGENILTGNIKLPNISLPSSPDNSSPSGFENPFHIGEGQPKNGSFQLEVDSRGYVHEELASILSESIGWIPDGRTPYITVKNDQGKDEKVYVFSGGQGNGSYTIRTDGTKPLREILLEKELQPGDVKQIFGPEMNNDMQKKYEKEQGIYYMGITTLLQLDKNNPNHVTFIYHGEKRPTRNDSGKFQAFIGWGESKDGLKTVKDNGVLITGVDIKDPGFFQGNKPDGTPNYRVTGAGQPAGIFNPETGFVQIGYTQWMANEGKSDNDPNKVKDQIDGARLKVTKDGSLDINSLEFFTNSGWSKNATKDNIKPIIPVRSDVPDMGYAALPSFFWSTSLNRFVAIGESNINFWYALSNGNDFSSWTPAEELYSFTKPVNIDDPEHFLDPVDPISHKPNFSPFEPGQRPSPNPNVAPIVSEPRNVLPIGGLWESYPMIWSINEENPSSDVVGDSFTIVHSIGRNQLGHQPGFSYGTIKGK